MKQAIIVGGLVAMLAACSPGVVWTEYVYKPQHFAVAFTAPPKVTTDRGPLLVEETNSDVDLGVTAACSIVGGKSSDQVLADTVEGTRSSGTVRNLTYTAIGQNVGRELFIDRPGLATVKERIFVQGNCLYLVFASSTGGTDDDRVTHFLDSFRLL